MSFSEISTRYHPNLRCWKPEQGTPTEPTAPPVHQKIHLDEICAGSVPQTFTADTNVARNPPESLKSDTSHTSRQHLPACTDVDEKCQQTKILEDVEQDAEAQHLMKDTSEETTPTQSE